MAPPRFSGSPSLSTEALAQLLLPPLHSLVLSQGSDFSKELLGCGCGAGGRLPGWPKGSASFVKLHIKVRAQVPASGQEGRAGAIRPRGLELGIPPGPRDPTSQHGPLPFPAVYYGSWLSP